MAVTRAQVAVAAAAFVAALIACGPAAVAPPPVNQPDPEAPAPAAPSGFAAVASERGFVFEMPSGFVEVPVVANRDVAYDHAIQTADGRIEMRFALRPYADDMPPLARTPQFSWTFFTTAVLNITRGGHLGEAATPVPVEPRLFGADDARIVRFRWFATDNGPDHFGNGYEEGGVIYLHRDGFGDAYTFVLYKDEDAAAALANEALNALRFAPRRD